MPHVGAVSAQRAVREGRIGAAGREEHTDIPLADEFKQDRVLGAAGAYTYLGSARYVSHEGNGPMNVTWQLDRPIPAKYLKKTNKLVVG